MDQHTYRKVLQGLVSMIQQDEFQNNINFHLSSTRIP